MKTVEKVVGKLWENCESWVGKLGRFPRDFGNFCKRLWENGDFHVVLNFFPSVFPLRKNLFLAVVAVVSTIST